jgi:ribosomal protein L31E
VTKGVVDFQVKYTDGWCTVATIDDEIAPFIWHYGLKQKYARFYVRIRRRQENEVSNVNKNKTQGDDKS